MALFKTTTVKENKREKGIALIFTLIMLSLLLILALSFALDSMFEQKAAYNSASASSAELMTQSQLQEVLSLVQNESANLSKTTWSRDINYDYTSAPLDYHTDQLKDLLKVTDLLDDQNNASAWDADGVNWNYIKDPADNNRIVGRTAFVIIPDEKIPLPSLVDERAGTTDYPKHDEINNTETRIGKYVSEINVRNAVPKTIAAHSSSQIDDLAFYLNWTQNGSIGFSNARYDGSWESFDNLYTTIEKSPSSFSFSNNDKDEFQTNLTITRTEEEEAFWADTNKNDKIDDGELYRRFDLTRTDWDKKTWDEDLMFMRKEILMLNTESGDRTSTNIYHPMQQWQDTDTNTTATTGLPWLALFGYNADGTAKDVPGSFPSVYARRCQIAANLKDYCDNDLNSTGTTVITRPTSDVDPAKWVSESNIPTFTGNESTPYINKVGAQITIKQGQQDLGSGFYNIFSQIEIRPCFELINIYQTSINLTNLKVFISGELQVKTTFSSYPEKVETFSFSRTMDADGWSGISYSDLMIDTNTADPVISLDTYKFDNLSTEGNTIQVDEIKLVIKKAVLYDDVSGIHYGYDYVKQLEDGSILSGPVFTGNNGTSPVNCWYGWSVHDPRQNLNAADWQKTGATKVNDASIVLSVLETSPGSGSYTSLPNSQMAAPNNTSDPSAVSTSWGDKENTSDPAYIPAALPALPNRLSTAFIRNAPMQSPWELGFIHRGAKWQTINLKKYEYRKAYTTFTSGTPYIAGGGHYAYGDANILDQIKMTHEPKSPQKINLNSTASAGFHALLSKIRYGCSPYIDSSLGVESMAGINPGTGVVVSGTSELATPTYPLSGASDVEKITETIIAKYKDTENTEKRKTRASIVAQLLLSDTTTTTSSPATSAELDINRATPLVSTANLNDALQEELIGKVVNLTKMGSQAGCFSIVVVSQTIKDVGGISPNTIKITKFPADSTVAVSRDCTIGTFDVKIDPTDPNKNVYFDEITASKKIIFKGRISGAGKIKILGLQYAN